MGLNIKNCVCEREEKQVDLIHDVDIERTIVMMSRMVVEGADRGSVRQ